MNAWLLRREFVEQVELQCDGRRCGQLKRGRYKSCSKVQQFFDMSPAEKSDWERLCNGAFPCIDA